MVFAVVGDATDVLATLEDCNVPGAVVPNGDVCGVVHVVNTTPITA